VSYVRTPEIIEKMRMSILENYKSGYVNPMKGKKRPDLSEYNRRYKSEQMKGEKNPAKRREVILKRLETRKGHTFDFAGPKNNNWRGGVSFEPYSSEFNKKLKLEVKRRDNFRCRLCGVTEEEKRTKTGQGLTVHHVDFDKRSNRKGNLLTLCHSCNGKMNSRAKFLELSIIFRKRISFSLRGG